LNKNRFSTEKNFQEFMKSYTTFEDLDNIKDDIPSGIKVADYAIRDLVVMELKTIRSDPKDKIVKFCNDIALRPDFPSVYGNYDFRKIVSLMDNEKEIIRKFELKAFRQIEEIVSKANKQIKSTIKHFSMNKNTSGILLLINESADMLEPDLLADYLCKLIISKSIGPEEDETPRFKHIHRIILLQSSHKIANESKGQLSSFIPIYTIENDIVDKPFAEGDLNNTVAQLIKKYSHFNGFNYAKNDDVNNAPLEQIKKSLPAKFTAQEKIEEHYRKNRYMENYSDEELIKYGSLVLSSSIAMFLKKNPLKVSIDKKMHIIKSYIELLEEGRLRPFDFKRMNIDTDSINRS